MNNQAKYVSRFKDLTSVDLDLEELFKRNKESIESALLIREVEEAFLRLFADGRMNGTVHTCVGQEFSAVAVAGKLRGGDWITSNHRCHGHFIAKTGDWKELIDELMGLESGVCAGVGSSQHLFRPGFLSNGPQGSLVPVATGIALHHKQSENDNISASFIGEGTLGEGNVYESMNLASCLRVPQLFVCENNLYSQSTPQAEVLAGDIVSRAQAFGLKTFESDTWDIENLYKNASAAIEYVRTSGQPAFLLISTYRLNAHSKGDDDRINDEVDFFRNSDSLTRLLELPAVQNIQKELQETIQQHIDSRSEAHLSLDDYLKDQLPIRNSNNQPLIKNDRIRMNQALNSAYRRQLESGAYLLGEDIKDPYGGAFKVSQGLSTDFPDKVITTPISEEAITGLGIGLSMMGSQAYVEIMFGDFITHTFDQVISNASKFHHMYAFQASAPVRIRTPMGGKRGYGPTHSQSLEKFFLGIDNFAVIATTSLMDPTETISELAACECPALIVENKVDYSKFLWQKPNELRADIIGGNLGSLVVSPKGVDPTCTIVAYGGLAREIADDIAKIFIETEELCELIVPLCLHPLHFDPIMQSALATGNLFVVEEGSSQFGFGSEVLARLHEAGGGEINMSRIGAVPVPIPSVSSLEHEVLPSTRSIIAALTEGGVKLQ
ncbi:MAG: dehydrogenase E1 component subunit alpha/beta [Gammaproteobacteria bacterium]